MDVKLGARARARHEEILRGVFVGLADRVQQRVDLALRSSGLLLQIGGVLGPSSPPA
jgi:hypothetical protein